MLESILGRKVDVLDDFDVPGGSVLLVTSAADCSSCVVRAFEILVAMAAVDDGSDLPASFLTVATDTNLAHIYAAGTNYPGPYAVDSLDVIKEALSFVQTPVILKVSSEHVIIDAYLPSLRKGLEAASGFIRGQREGGHDEPN